MPTMITHNPCRSRSRRALAVIRGHGIESEIVSYLERPPSPDERQRIIDQLGFSVREVVRGGEADYRELGLTDESLSEEALVEASCTHPSPFPRAIAVHGKRARIGRSLESCQGILP